MREAERACEMDPLCLVVGAEGDPALACVAVEPRVEPLRSDPRYLRLIDLLGL